MYLTERTESIHSNNNNNEHKLLSTTTKAKTHTQRGALEMRVAKIAKILRILMRRERTGLTAAACLSKAFGYTLSLFVYAHLAM